jgi:hypothetical protein
LGHTREELLGMTPSEIDAPDSYGDVASTMQQLKFVKNVRTEQNNVAKDVR